MERPNLRPARTRAARLAFAKLGEDGWELAGVRTDLKLREGDGETTAVYFFKRPKRQE